MAKFFKPKNIAGGTLSSSSQNSFSNVNSRAISNAKSWNTSNVSKRTQNQLKQAEKPFSSEYTGYLDKVLADINKRKDFNYDLNKDALYQQYAKQYKMMGNQAMQESMANATALSGGYANSYAETAGQQAYNGYLQELNNVVPDLYAQARSTYDNETNALYNRAGLYQGLESDAYNRFLENRNYYADKYNNEWSRNAVSHSKQTDRNNQTERSSSSSSSSSSNYQRRERPQLEMPTYEEIKDASMKGKDANGLLRLYAPGYDTLPTYNDWKKAEANRGKSKADYRLYLTEEIGNALYKTYGPNAIVKGKKN